MRKRHSTNWAAHLRLLAVAILWGGSWPAGSIVAANLPASSSATWRFLIASIAMLALLPLRKTPPPDPKKPATTYPPLTTARLALIALSGFMGITCYATFFMMGLQHIPSGRAALFITLTPALVTVLAGLIFGEKLNATILTGVTTSVIGAMVVVAEGNPLRIFSDSQNVFGLGETLMLGCVISWAGYSLIGKITTKYAPSFKVTTLSIVAGTAALLPIGITRDGLIPELQMHQNGLAKVDAEWQVWAALVFLSLGATVLCYAWFFDGVKEVGAGAAASYVSLVPVFGVLFSWLTLGESLDWTIWVGGTLAVGGVTLINRAQS